MPKSPIDFTVSFRPTLRMVGEIKNWLIEEYNKTGEGFYCNWNLIQSAFDDKEVATLIFNKRTVGFICWRITNLSATIDITEIAPQFRGNGAGKILVQELIKKLKKKGVYAVELQCSPPSSEIFWRKLDFESFPLGLNKSSNVELYKILTNSQPLADQELNFEVIELWNAEPRRTNNVSSTWKWILDFESGKSKLKKPIVFPAGSDWRIRWRKGQEVFYDEKVKRFQNEDSYCFGFLMIFGLERK